MRSFKHTFIRTLTICLTYLYVNHSQAQSTTVSTLLNAGNSSNINKLTIDINGNLYYFEQGFSTDYNNLLRKVTQSGTVSTLFDAGNSSNINGLTIDADRNLYYFEQGSSTSDQNLLRKVTQSGTVSTLFNAGNSSNINGLTIDVDGNLYYFEQGSSTNYDNLLRKVTQSGIVSTVLNAGNSSNIYELTVDTNGNLYYFEQGFSTNYNCLLRKVTQSGIVTTIHNGGNSSQFNGLTVGTNGILYYFENGSSTGDKNLLRKVTQSGSMSTFFNAGNAQIINGPIPDAAGNTYYFEQGNSTGYNNLLQKVALDVALPLEWLEFQVHTHNEKATKKVNINWVTASERNIQHFIVERSRNGKTFEQSGALVAANNTESKNYYQVVDVQPWLGVSFYRIHEVTFSGKDAYSPIRSVVLDNGNPTFTLFPNPKEKNTPLSIQTNWTENYTFNLYDATGKKIYSHLCNGSIQLEQFDLNSGLYFYECNTLQSRIASGKIIVP